jgi:hypothetical protein
VSADLNVGHVSLSNAFVGKTDGSVTHVGSGTTVVVGPFVWAGTVTVDNDGTWQVTDGAVTNYSASDQSTFLNYGTIDYVGSQGGFMSAHRFVNMPSGLVVKSGTAATGGIYANDEMENDGTVRAEHGAFIWNSSNGTTEPANPAPGDGVSDGHFTTANGAHLELANATTVSASATYDAGVWVTGTISGLINLPTGVTLNLGDDPATANWPEIGILKAATEGDGTLNISGIFNSGTNFYAQVAADLNVHHVVLNNSTFVAKPDGTATQIPDGTTVTLTATPLLASNLHLVDAGTIDFGTNDYFSCSTCTVTVASSGFLVVNNPDSSFRSFIVDSGTFDNAGVFEETGYYPGVDIGFGTGATVLHRGSAQVGSLAQPTWLQQLRDNSTLQAIAGDPSMSGLGIGVISKIATSIGNIGVGTCVGVNLPFVIVGASASGCVVVDPAGHEVVEINVAISGGLQLSKDKQGWHLSNVFTDPSGDASFDVGETAMWTTGPDAQPFDATQNIDGPFTCETGSFSTEIGGIVQHCWGPSSLPFSLDNGLHIFDPGVHTGYVGVTMGAGLSATLTESYSVVINRGDWYSITLHECPLMNTAAPQVSGTPQVGQTLSVSTGTWSGTATITYQWQRCTSTDPTTCSDLSGATASQYVVTSADLGDYLDVVVTATNNAGGGARHDPDAGGVIIVHCGQFKERAAAR